MLPLLLKTLGRGGRNDVEGRELGPLVHRRCVVTDGCVLSREMFPSGNLLEEAIQFHYLHKCVLNRSYFRRFPFKE